MDALNRAAQIHHWTATSLMMMLVLHWAYSSRCPAHASPSPVHESPPPPFLCATLADTTTGKFTLLSAKVPDEMLVSEVPAAAASATDEASSERRGTIAMAKHMPCIVITCRMGLLQHSYTRFTARHRNLNDYAYVCLVSSVRLWGLSALGGGPALPRGARRGVRRRRMHVLRGRPGCHPVLGGSDSPLPAWHGGASSPPSCPRSCC